MGGGEHTGNGIPDQLYLVVCVSGYAIECRPSCRSSYRSGRDFLVCQAAAWKFFRVAGPTAGHPASIRSIIPSRFSYRRSSYSDCVDGKGMKSESPISSRNSGGTSSCCRRSRYKSDLRLGGPRAIGRDNVGLKTLQPLPLHEIVEMPDEVGVRDDEQSSAWATSCGSSGRCSERCSKLTAKWRITPIHSSPARDAG